MDEQQSSNGIIAWIQQNSTTITLVVVGLLVGLVFLKRQAPAADTSTQQQAQGDYSGLQRDANGNPIVYRDVADTFINISKVQDSYNNTTTEEHPIEPGHDHIPTPYSGLLGPGVKVDIAKRTFAKDGKTSNIPLPDGTTYLNGGQGRVWYILPGSNIQNLLTSGWGPPVTNSGLPIN